MLIAIMGTISNVDGVTLSNSGEKIYHTKGMTQKIAPFKIKYRAKLRVHLGNSSRLSHEFLPIFTEINDIWWSQAGICFDIHTVEHDVPLDDGFDMWFAPYIGGLNGYYNGEHIQMTDNPSLGFAPNPAKYSAARTAAHELGHFLDLPHLQNSDDNLMRSKTYGWQLNRQEVEIARESAADSDHIETTVAFCDSPRIN